MYAYFPVEWDFGEVGSDGAGGPVVVDAGAVYFCASDDVYEGGALADTAFTEGDVMARTSLCEMVADVIDGHTTNNGEVTSEARQCLLRLRGAFADCISQIDAALAKIPA